MRMILTTTLLLAAIQVGHAQQGAGQATGPSGDVKTLMGIIDALNQSVDDLNNLGQAISGDSPEVPIILSLQRTANDCAEYFSVVADLISLRDSMTAGEDRRRVQTLLTDRTHYYTGLIDYRLKYLANDLSSTKRPGIANLAGHMNDLIHKGHGILDTIAK